MRWSIGLVQRGRRWQRILTDLADIRLDILMTKPKILSLPNKYYSNRYVCTHEFQELTAYCPMTKLPDFYTIVIKYEPGRRLMELKSLKYYLASYRDVGILHEELANAILGDIADAIDPRWISVELTVNVRGGIATTIYLERGRISTVSKSRHRAHGTPEEESA